MAYRFLRLSSENKHWCDCVLLLQSDEAQIVKRWQRFLHGQGLAASLRTFNAQELPAKLGYGYYHLAGLAPGSTHYPLLCLSRVEHYARYWLIEYDADCRGKWSDLFLGLESAGHHLLASHVLGYIERPDWFWWDSLRSPACSPVALESLRKAFLPVCRISATALRLIDGCHRDGWRGHYELLIPALLDRHDLSIGDLGALSRCYSGRDQDLRGSRQELSTMRYRPPVDPGEIESRGDSPCLYHPIKGDFAWGVDGLLRGAELSGHQPVGVNGGGAATPR